jgi:hypothetical protein
VPHYTPDIDHRNGGRAQPEHRMVRTISRAETARGPKASLDRAGWIEEFFAAHQFLTLRHALLISRLSKNRRYETLFVG